MKRKTITTLIFMSALLIAGAFAFTGCGAGDTESGGEEPTTASSEEPAPSDATAEDAWKSAYRGILEEHADGIRNYGNPEELGSTFDGRKSAALCDLDEDGTPELLFMESEGYLDVLYIYSYKNGKAEEMTYPWTWTGAYEEDSMKYYCLGSKDYVNNDAAVKSIIDDGFSFDFLGGQDHYSLFREVLPLIDVSTMSAYDQNINSAMDTQVNYYIAGEKDLDTALADFAAAVVDLYPEITAE